MKICLLMRLICMAKPTKNTPAQRFLSHPILPSTYIAFGATSVSDGIIFFSSQLDSLIHNFPIEAATWPQYWITANNQVLYQGGSYISHSSHSINNQSINHCLLCAEITVTLFIRYSYTYSYTLIHVSYSTFFIFYLFVCCL